MKIATMKQSHLLSIVSLLLLLSPSSLVTPIRSPNRSPLSKSPSQSPVGGPAPEPSGSDCSSVIYSMMDCISYLSIGSNETKPEKSCCGAIEKVLEFNPQCICSGLVSASQMGIELNNTRALSTPKTCKLPMSPPHCGIMTPSATTPGASPVFPSAGTPKTSPSAAKSPVTSPSSEEAPSITAPSSSTSGTSSGTALTIIAVTLSSIAFVSAFSN